MHCIATLLNSNAKIRNKTLLMSRMWTLLLVLTMTGCSFQFPGVYRLEIQQGNIVTQEMVDQLQVGMTKRQVNFVLGTPLIQDSFNQDRWDYYYTKRSIDNELSRKRFTVYFAEDKLIQVEGDFELTNTTPVEDNSVGGISEQTVDAN